MRGSRAASARTASRGSAPPLIEAARPRAARRRSRRAAAAAVQGREGRLERFVQIRDAREARLQAGGAVEGQVVFREIGEHVPFSAAICRVSCS